MRGQRDVLRLVEPGLAAVDQKRAGELMWVNVEDLFVPAEYQRTLIETHARNIAREFSWEVFGVLVVAARQGGVYAIVDGQNRWRAAGLRGLNQVPAVVHRFRNIEAEAAAFDRLNTVRKSIGVRARQKSGYFQRDPVSVAAHEFVQAVLPRDDYLPLATVRRAAVRWGPQLETLKPLVRDLLALSNTPLRRHFLEGACILEARLGPENSLADRWRRRVMACGYDDILAGMRIFENRVGGFSSSSNGLRSKSDAVLYALNTRPHSHEGSRQPRKPLIECHNSESVQNLHTYLDAAK